MLTEQELLVLMRDVESDRVERTVSTTDTAKFCEAICAFANDLPHHRLPGYLLVGVRDDGRPSGLEVTDRLLLNLAAARSDGNIQPLPAMNVSKHTLSTGEGDVAVVEVLPSDLPPVRYKGRVHIRVGPRRAIAGEAEERMLTERRTAVSRTFDARACPDCRLGDLVLDLFLVTYRSGALAPELLEENARDVREQMASLRFYDLRRGCATFAGALLLAKDPRRWVPGAYVQFVRFGGTELTDDPLDERAFSGDLLTVLRELDAFVSVGIEARPEGASALREEKVAAYPAAALREMLMNAVMHRDYESNAPIRFHWFGDRVEIQNPGGLYGLATPENFPRQTDYRNPVIAEAMKALGYVNKFGRGVLRAQHALAANGSPPAEFVFEPTHFLATIQRRP